jgi:DNA-binding response OmpR family regulator
VKYQEEQKQEINTIRRALLVEDYDYCQRVMMLFLQKLDYQVDLAADGATAIKNVESESYDLIIEDIGLKNIPGKEVIQIIRESKRNIDTPLIVWSAYVNKMDEEKYLTWGADGVLVKACGIKELKKSIHQCLLTPRYERKLHYQLKNFKKKWEYFIKKGSELKDSECVNQFKCSLHEALISLEEYHQWLNFHANGGKNPS